MWFYFPDTLGLPLEEVAAIFGDQDEVAGVSSEMRSSAMNTFGPFADTCNSICAISKSRMQTSRTSMVLVPKRRLIVEARLSRRPTTWIRRHESDQ